MDEQKTMIDNVDVSECEHLTETRHCKAQMAVMGTDANKCKCFPNCYYKQLARAEQENKRLLEIINANPLETVDIDSAFEIEKLKEQLQAKEQECNRLKWYMQEIRMQELSHLDIEWDDYETNCIDTEYTNIINLVEEALEERSPEDCRYDR